MKHLMIGRLSGATGMKVEAIRYHARAGVIIRCGGGMGDHRILEAFVEPACEGALS